MEAMLRGRRRQVASPSLESSSRGSSWVTLSLDHGPSAAADDAPPNPPRKHQLWSVSHSCGRATASMDEDSDDSDSEKHFRRNKRATAKDKEDAMTSMPGTNECISSSAEVFVYLLCIVSLSLSSVDGCNSQIGTFTFSFRVSECYN